MAPGAVTLDLFGTLVDFSIERDEPPLVAELLDRAGIDADPGAVLSTWVDESLAVRGRTPFRTVRASLVRGAEATARRHGIDIEPAFWASALESLWATRPLREEAEDVLEALETSGTPFAVVTNADEPVLGALTQRTGLASQVPVIVSSHRARAYKPHPRVFRMALNRLGVPPEAAVHVGDDPGEDGAGARAAGMRAEIVDLEPGALADRVRAILSG